MFDWTIEDGARTTEGWVKHDLEAGQLDTMWLQNAAVDSMDAPRDHNASPVEYLEALLSNVDITDADKLRAALTALVGVIAEAGGR